MDEDDFAEGGSGWREKSGSFSLPLQARVCGYCKHDFIVPLLPPFYSTRQRRRGGGGESLHFLFPPPPPPNASRRMHSFLERRRRVGLLLGRPKATHFGCGTNKGRGHCTPPPRLDPVPPPFFTALGCDTSFFAGTVRTFPHSYVECNRGGGRVFTTALEGGRMS